MSVAGLFRESPGFDPGRVHARYMVDTVALWRVSLPFLQFSSVSIIPPMLHTHLHRITSLIRTWGWSEQSRALSGIGGHYTNMWGVGYKAPQSGALRSASWLSQLNVTRPRCLLSLFSTQSQYQFSILTASRVVRQRHRSSVSCLEAYTCFSSWLIVRRWVAQPRGAQVAAPSKICGSTEWHFTSRPLLSESFQFVTHQLSHYSPIWAVPLPLSTD